MRSGAAAEALAAVNRRNGSRMREFMVVPFDARFFMLRPPGRAPGWYPNPGFDRQGGEGSAGMGFLIGLPSMASRSVLMGFPAVVVLVSASGVEAVNPCVVVPARI